MKIAGDAMTQEDYARIERALQESSKSRHTCAAPDSFDYALDCFVSDLANELDMEFGELVSQLAKSTAKGEQS